jgi:predicted O-linked N-acetylglucosamine transferase (SPINDLY family)
MMSKFKKLYRDFFGLKEQTKPSALPKFSDEDIENLNKAKDAYKEMSTAMQGLGTTLGESELEEAQLVNNLTDYRGGIEYVLRDSATAQSVAQEIQEWAERKGFTVVKKTLSPTGKIGYFYFRLGQDPALESQKLQGYLAQKPELKHFRFNVRQQAAKKPQEKI